MQFLIVDDSSTMRRILTQTLARMGYTETFEASSGPEALECLASRPVDVVLIDWSMPGMTGLELLRSIRSTPETSKIPVLMVTANSRSADIVRAMNIGVDGYVVKPFTIDTIQRQIETALRR